MFGRHGHYYRIDLQEQRLTPQPISEHTLHRYIGGVGLGVRLLLEENIEADPRSPDAPLAMVFSPLVGSPLTTSAKYAIVARSPLTGRLNDSLVSSGFALAGKRTGADALVIVGRAARPSVLLIDEGQMQLAPAGDLWGMTCGDAEAALQARFGTEWRFSVIGPAGENQVAFATISHDGRHAGRGGHGAVLGAKLLKAIGVRGSQTTAWSDPAGLAAVSKRLSERSFGPATAKYRELGTAANLLLFNRLHCLPTRNFQVGSQPGVESLSPESLSAARKKTQASCAACTIGCEHIYGFGDQQSTRVEYENLFALGPLCGINDQESVLAASQRCDALGLDTISMGGVAAFAMECVERGLLNETPWLTFGNGDGLRKAIEATVAGGPLGELLKQGVRRMAEEIGQGSIEFAAQIKGLEMPGYEPRGVQTLALGMAVGARGADHNRSGAYEADFSDQVDRRRISTSSANLAIQSEDLAAMMDSLILCKFIRGALDNFYDEAAEMLRLTTGSTHDGEDLRRNAARIISAKKRFNERVGWTADEDTLPARFLDNSLPDDAEAIIDAAELAKAIREYYRLRGWDAKGRLSDAARRDLL